MLWRWDWASLILSHDWQSWRRFRVSVGELALAQAGGDVGDGRFEGHGLWAPVSGAANRYERVLSHTLLSADDMTGAGGGKGK